MRLRTIAAATAAASALALGAAGTSHATAPALHSAAKAPATLVFQHGDKRISYSAPHGELIARSGIEGTKITAAAGTCGLINIGAPGSFSYAGVYAGQVEQMYDPCPGTWDYGNVVAHWEFAGGFITSQYAGYPVDLAISSPHLGVNGVSTNYWFMNAGYATAANKDVFIDGIPHGDASPDDWRVGSEINACQWISWGTLHNYGGWDEGGPVVTSGQGVTPRAPGA
ncbi:hypothetical protein [Streptacidiphilus neutrinimicus]|uniref:hypothetical protein n=1 Tax=Streptacidiphilus neutrinimicus TaxID=105420 RepID=UPI0005A7EF76|nr:hypothetical protein [Streptacidiphilus neutrinimicus]